MNVTRRRNIIRTRTIIQRGGIFTQITNDDEFINQLVEKYKKI
jgi:hypothetical protein